MRRGIFTLIFVATFSANAFAGINMVNKSSGGQALTRANQVAARFLEDLRVVYQLPDSSDFARQETKEALGHFCMKFAQTFHSVEILGSGATICFDPSGAEQDRSEELCAGTCLDRAVGSLITKDMAAEQAERRMIEALGSEFGQVVSVDVQEAWIEPMAGQGLVGSYLVHFDTKRQGSPFPEGKYIAFLDGVSGELLGVENRIFHNMAFGNVYLKDPATTPTPQIMELNHLLSVDQLAHIDFRVVNEDGENVSSMDGDYIFGPEDPEFDEVQAYYSLDFAISRMGDWGYMQTFPQIPIYVHFGEGMSNAFYDGMKIVLGDGDGETYLSFARDNTILTHEYGHAVVDHLAGIRVISEMGDGGAIHEGQADYFACAIYEDPVLGAGVIADGTPLRRCDTFLPYDEKDGESHFSGQVWSGALWEIRTILGGERVDRLALQALIRLESTGPFGTTYMMDMVDALLSANDALYGGEDQETIMEVFRLRDFPLEPSFVAAAAADGVPSPIL